ncbi:hypothetical protein FHX76_000151 [Lysinibacter cavernae]|uniref:Uncharacterized protein n=1 Tax=Lysinibacter cavernae TaxID=1640652 RepID=A0A7X5TSJ5_9MICO|nr:hypothetical protein [Lysinibacter cavernae]
MSYSQRQADFNESTYAMYLTVEIQRWLHAQGDLDGIALLPSLRQEADLGYDIAIPRRWAMLYLQFKMPRYLRRSNANEYAVFGKPYFRFAVKTDVTLNGLVQHNALYDLEVTGADVFYASPCFLTSDELAQHVSNDGLYPNSVFPRPSQLGRVLPDSQHCYAYTSTGDIRAFSEPGPPMEASFESVQRTMSASVEVAETRTLEDFVERALLNFPEGESRPTYRRYTESRLAKLQDLGIRASKIGLLPFLIAGR